MKVLAQNVRAIFGSNRTLICNSSHSPVCPDCHRGALPMSMAALTACDGMRACITLLIGWNWPRLHTSQNESTEQLEKDRRVDYGFTGH